MKIMKHFIEVVHDEPSGYYVYVDGETVLECLAEDELDEISIGEVIEMYLKERC